MSAKDPLNQNGHSARRPGRSRPASLSCFLVLILLSSSLLMLVARRPSTDRLTLSQTGQTTRAPVSESGTEIRPSFPLHIDGAVKRPGLYYFNEGDILSLAIEKSGGLTEEADLATINLAMRLTAHTKVYIPRQGEAIPQAMAIGSDPPGKVDLNLASQAQLETLPGVGQVTASAIIDYRERYGPFESIEDLMQVPGIKEGRFSALKDSICVSLP